MRGIKEAVLAKREISKMWSDINKWPYKYLFSPNITASDIWVAVTIKRWVDEALDEERSKHEGRDRLVVVHGNYLVLWAVMQHVGLRRINHRKLQPFTPPVPEGDVKELTGRCARLLIALIDSGYQELFPATLFKNTNTCEAIGVQLSTGLRPAAKSPR